MKYVILEKAKQVQVKPYQRKGKYVIGYQRTDPRQKEISEMFEKPVKLGERIYPKGEIRWSKPVLGIGAKVVYMSPDEYIDRIHISKRMTVQELKDYKEGAIKRGAKGILEFPPLSQGKIDQIKAQIAQGREIEMPFIEYDDRGIVTSQEGYHRALVAKEMGNKQIPVMVIGEQIPVMVIGEESKPIGEKQREYAKKMMDMGFYKEFDPETQVMIGARFPHIVPRYMYHRPPSAERMKEGIKAYKSRSYGGEQEAIDHEFKQKDAKVVWLSRGITYGKEATIKIDLAQLDPKDLRHTGQAEGNVWHLGNIPESAIVREKKIWEVKKGMYVTLEKAERTSREQLQKIFDEFIPHCQKYLGLKEIPKIKLIDAKVSKKKKTFGIHHEDKNIIELNVRDRHPIDILRTLCHELTHHEQDQENSKKTDLGREDDANASAGFIVRKFVKKHPNLFSLGALEK